MAWRDQERYVIMIIDVIPTQFSMHLYRLLWVSGMRVKFVEADMQQSNLCVGNVYLLLKEWNLVNCIWMVVLLPVCHVYFNLNNITGSLQ